MPCRANAKSCLDSHRWQLSSFELWQNLKVPSLIVASPLLTDCCKTKPGCVSAFQFFFFFLSFLLFFCLTVLELVRASATLGNSTAGKEPSCSFHPLHYSQSTALHVTKHAHPNVPHASPHTSKKATTPQSWYGDSCQKQPHHTQ